MNYYYYYYYLEHFMASSVINKSTDTRKTVRDFFFTTNLTWQAGRALKFEENWGVKQTKKTRRVIRVTFENTSSIINNFSRHLIGLFCLQTKERVFLGHKNYRWLTLSTLEWLVNKLTDWTNDQNSFWNVPDKFLVWNIFPFRDVILKVEKIQIKYGGTIIKNKK